MAELAVNATRERRFIPALRPDAQWIALALLAVFIAGLSFAPLARLAYTALMPDGTLDLGRLVELFGRRRIAVAISNTLYVSVLSTLLAVVVGGLAAVAMVHTNMRWKTAWVFGFVLPLMIPPQVTALAWVQSFSPSSPVLGFLGLALPPGTRHPLYSSTGIILLLGLYNAPLVFLTIRAALQRIPGNLAEAARAAGAGGIMLLFTVLLPLARAGIFAGAALAFVSAIGNFGIQAMLGIPARFPTLITLIYQQMNNYGPSALADMAALAFLLSLITVAGLVLNSFLARKGDVRVEGASRPIRIELGRWRLPAEGLAWLFLLATLVLPLSGLFSTSLVRGFGQPLNWETLTFSNYAAALFNQASIRHAFTTSFLLTLGTVAVLLCVSVLLGYFLSWRRGPLVRFLHLASETAYALPGIILGVAMILFFLRPLPIINVSIYGTVWIILAAYLSNFLALALRPVLGGFAQVDRSLEEAARVAGAGFLARLRDIIVPLVAPAAFAGAVIVFMSALNEIQVSILLISSSARTIGPMIILLEESGASTLAAAVGCLMVLVVLLLMAVSTLFASRLPQGVLPWRN